MKPMEWMLVGVLVLACAGCVAHGKQQAKASAAPPTPAPTAAPAPPPPRPQPLSIPQTDARLPEPQPISAEALATIRRVEPPVEPASEPRPARSSKGTVAGPPRPEPPAAQAQTPAAAAPAESERGPVQEIVSPAEAQKMKESAAARKAEVRKTLEQVQAHALTPEQSNQVKRIQSFLQLSDDAEKRSDMRQADALAERALVLARELQSGTR